MPAAWDRLADATQPVAGATLPLSVITFGEVHSEELVALTPLVAKIEQLVLDVPPRDPVAKHRAEFNRAIDAATSDWVLIVRERETVDEALAKEIVEAASSGKARGFRIRSTPFYSGAPLKIGVAEGGELRLFHRRYYLRYADKGEWKEPTVQGSVVRLANAFRSVTFTTPEEHRQHLAGKAAPHSKLRRLLLFASYVLAVRTLDRTTLRYLWIEAGFDTAAAL